MAESKELNFLNSILANSKCFLCKRYLSCSPILVQPNGNSACSQCMSSTSEPPSCRNLTLEALLSVLSFPCQFADHGCKESLQFGCTQKHESECDYRTFGCSAFSGDVCSWRGSVGEVAGHFSEMHPDLKKAKAEFKLDVHQDQDEVLMVTSDNVEFIIKYKYCADSSRLECVLRHTMFNVQETLCKIRLSNASDNDYNFMTKIGECLPYNGNFYDLQDLKVLTLSKYFEMLDNPDCILITIDVNVIKYKEANVVVNEILQSVRCARCRGHLVPPIFSGPNGEVCYCCHRQFGDSDPVQNVELQVYVANSNFSCRWRGCDFVGVGADVGRHEHACQFRIIRCLHCSANFMWKEAQAHLETHGYQYVLRNCVYKVNLIQICKYICTFKNHEVVYIIHDYYSDGHRNLLSVQTSGCLDFAAKVQLEHEHCKLKSKVFTVHASKHIAIRSCDLPICFQHREELTVTLTI